MKILSVKSHILQYDLKQPLGYSQQFYHKRTAHLIEITTNEGITGWGECFGAGNVAIGNKTIVEHIIQPIIIGENPLDRDMLWHKVYNLLRDHGQKGMPLQALSGVDIALWDIAGKVAGLSLAHLIGGRHRENVPVYGYGMMLRPERVDTMVARFAEEAAAIKEAGFIATKMKVGLGVKNDIKLARAVHTSIKGAIPFMVDANHCYNTSDALYMGRALEELDAYWFEEPIAPEDYDGYQELRAALKINIAGGEAEFNRWGWRALLEKRCLDIAQPEVCALGGVSEYLRVLALCHAHFTPVVNHVWGSAIAIATNLQLLSIIPPLPGGLYQNEPMLEFDTTDNIFRDQLLREPLNIQKQIKDSGGYARIPNKPGIGAEPDSAFIKHYSTSVG